MHLIKLILLTTLISLLKSTEVNPFSYPLFKQCNSTWGQIIMGSDNDTICEVGCLMTSISMALNGHNITINGKISDPETLNTFLQQNNGYVDGSDLVESIIPNIQPSHVQWIGFADSIGNQNIQKNNIQDRDQVISALNRNDIIIIAHVLSPEATTTPDHFVLVVGYDDTDTSFYYVNDPGFNKTTYDLSRIKNWRVFLMK